MDGVNEARRSDDFNEVSALAYTLPILELPFSDVGAGIPKPELFEEAPEGDRDRDRPKTMDLWESKSKGLGESGLC